MWTEVHVTATNFNTGEPLNDVFISIVESKFGAFSSKDKAIYESFTDDEGHFYYGWKAKRNSSVDYLYVAQANPEKYKQVEFKQLDYLQKGDVHHYNLKLVEYGGLNMNFENVNCYDETDKLHYRYYFKKSPSDPSYMYIYSAYWENSSKDGCISNHVPAYQTLPAFTYKIEWNVTRFSGYTEGSDEIIVPDGDTVTYVLEY